MDMDHLHTAHDSSLYGVEYGDVGVSSMIALMTEHEPHESESSIMTAVPSSFASFHAPAECLLSAAMFQAPQACQGDKLHRQSVAGHCVMEQLIMPEQAAISDSSLPSVKTEVCSHFGNQFEFHREQTGSCYAESSLMVGPLVTSLTSQPGDMVMSLEVTSPRFSKVGAPPEVLARLDALSEEYESRQHREWTQSSTSSWRLD